MEGEDEQIKAMEKPSVKRVTSETYNNNNTSGYVSGDSSENDNLSNQSSGLTVGASTSDPNISRQVASNLLNQLAGLTARESQVLHETVSMPDQSPDIETSRDSTDSLDLPSPPKDSPTYNEEQESASPIESDAIDSMSSQSSLCSNSYLCSRASSDLPSMPLDDDEEEIIPPLKEEFLLNEQSTFEEFEKKIDYRTVLGAGAYGKCYLAAVERVDTKEERVFCVKKFECRDCTDEILALQLARKEKVEDIVSFYGAVIKGRNVTVFMEFMEGGTISDLIKERKEEPWPIVPEIDILSYLEDVLNAQKFLHQKGIVHRDIKGDNVLLDKCRLRAKLADFGVAKGIGKGITITVDIWKTGCLLLEMWKGERPPLLIDERALQRQNSRMSEEFIPSEAMDITKQLLRLLFRLDSSISTAAAVLKHSEAFPVKELLKRLKDSQSLEKST